MNLLALLALFMLAKPGASSSSSSPAATSGTTKPGGTRVIGQVLQIPLSDGTNAIVAKIQAEKTGTPVPQGAQAIDAIVIARGTVYGSSKGVAAVLRCGSETDARAIAEEIRGKF